MRGELGADVVVNALAAFNRRDVDALLSTMTPEVELLPFAAKLAGTTYIGADGVHQWFADLEDEWSEWQVEFDDVRAVRDGVLAIGRVIACGRETNVDVNIPAAFAYTLQGGRIARLESFADRAEAEAFCRVSPEPIGR